MITGLPAITHDSIIYANIEDKSVIDLLNIYKSKVDKQIFITIADSDKFNTDNGNITDDYSVIKLDVKTNALYGFQFNIVENKKDLPLSMTSQ